MILPLLLAASAYLTPAGPQGSYHIEFYNDMPTQQRSPISSTTQVLDAINVGSPVQTGYDFDELEQRIPVRTVIPRSQRNLIPIEERMAMQEYELEQKRNQLAVSGAELNQTIARNTFDYDQKILQQATQATQSLGQFDPASETFEQEFGKFQAANPLAFQNPAFRQLADRLVATNQQIRQTGQQTKSGIAKQGQAALTAYDKALQDGKTPFEAQAIASDVEAQEQAATARDRANQEMRDRIALQGGPAAVGAYDDDLKAQSARIANLKTARQALVDSGQDDLVAEFDRRNPVLEVDPTISIGKASQAADQQKRALELQEKSSRPMTRVDYTELIAANRKMLESAGKYEDLSPEDKVLFDFNRDKANQYIREQGGSPTPAITEGKTATNKKTGEKIVYRNGNWEPVK